MTATQYVPNSKVYHCNIAIGNCKPCEPRYQNSPQLMLRSTHFSTRFQDSVKKYWHEMTLQPAKTYSDSRNNTAARKRIQCCLMKVFLAETKTLQSAKTYKGRRTLQSAKTYNISVACNAHRIIKVLCSAMLMFLQQQEKSFHSCIGTSLAQGNFFPGSNIIRMKVWSLSRKKSHPLDFRIFFFFRIIHELGKKNVATETFAASDLDWHGNVCCWDI